MRHSKLIDSQKKPEIITYYNNTKCGVDVLDMCYAIYSSGRRTRRWPLAVFYHMINLASSNGYILYLCYGGWLDTIPSDTMAKRKTCRSVLQCKRGRLNISAFSAAMQFVLSAEESVHFMYTRMSKTGLNIFKHWAIFTIIFL